jgi:hypothetical protein
MNHAMRYVLSGFARWRIQTEIQLKGRVAPSLAIGLVLGLMTAAIVWTLAPDRRPGLAACVIGITAFGGMFLIAAIAVGMFMARRPQQILEDLLSEPAKTGRSCWKMALLAEAERYIATANLRPRRLKPADKWHNLWETRHRLATSTGGEVPGPMAFKTRAT